MDYLIGGLVGLVLGGAGVGVVAWKYVAKAKAALEAFQK